MIRNMNLLYTFSPKNSMRTALLLVSSMEHGDGDDGRLFDKNLWRAAHTGDLKRVMELLGRERGHAAMDREDEYGTSPLHFAATGGSPDVV